MCEYSERRLSANINVTQSFLFKRIKSTQFSLKPNLSPRLFIIYENDVTSLVAQLVCHTVKTNISIEPTSSPVLKPQPEVKESTRINWKEKKLKLNKTEKNQHVTCSPKDHSSFTVL